MPRALDIWCLLESPPPPSEVLLVTVGTGFLVMILAATFQYKINQRKERLGRRPKYQGVPVPKLSPEEQVAQRLEHLNARYDHFLGKAEFQNKHTERLEDFILNPSIGKYDLLKFAQLNGIFIQCDEGWYPLLIELIQELDAKGWNRRVVTIKEKYGELRFYAGLGPELNAVVARYTERSTETCERCGAPGQMTVDHGGWRSTLCEAHRFVYDESEDEDA